MRFIFLLASLIISNFSFSQAFVPTDKVSASDRADTDRFGFDVQMDGHFAIVGAYADDFGASNPNMGSAYIYEEVSVGEWQEVQKIFASDQNDYDRFATSVAISGTYAVVGSPQNDYDENDANYIDNAGAAYIYEQDGSGNWVEVQKIVASDRGTDDEFGWSISIDSNTIVVGAHQENHDINGNNYMYHTGSVYIFERDGAGVWNETQKIVASDRAPDINYPNGYSGEDVADQFGDAVDISGDYIVVGAFHHDYDNSGNGTGALWSSGAAYIFEKSGGVWTEVAIIQNQDREAWDRFGCSVSIDTNRAIIGAYSEDELADGVSGSLTNPGSAYVFERNGAGAWLQVQKLVPNDRHSGDHFAYDIELDGDYVVFGCHSDNHDENDANYLEDAGSAYIFHYSGGTWTEFQKVTPSDRREYDEFGIAVGLSGDTWVVGAFQQDLDSASLDSITDAGAAYFYTNDVCLNPISHSQSVDLCPGTSLTIGTNTYTSAGVYTDVLVAANGCDSVLTTTISIYSPVDVSTSSTTYDATALATGVSYQWLDCNNGFNALTGETNATLSNAPAGSYAVEVSDANCTDTSTCIAISCLNGTYNEAVDICGGQSYTIGTSTYTSSGNYTDTLQSIAGCDSIIITALTVATPIDLTVTQNINTLISNESGADTYQWFECNSGFNIPGATSDTYMATSFGEYAVIITQGSCTDTTACTLVDTFSDVASSLSDFSIYPNPANNQLNITTNLAGAYELSVLDLSGKIVLSQNNNAGITKLDVSLLPKGMYLLRISHNGSVEEFQCIIQ